MLDFTPIVYLAYVGLVAIALAVLVGVPWLIWFLAHHIQFV